MLHLASGAALGKAVEYPKGYTLVKKRGAAGGNAQVYFENLNGLRFIAASLVIVHHTEQFKSLFSLSNVFDVPGVILMGKLGVTLFFVLSGFLISYLLATELEVTGSISMSRFYMRRILRIWPLYFLIVTLALLCPLSPTLTLDAYPRNMVWNHLTGKFLLFVFFLPNLLTIVYGVIPFASQTWSIGAEEQFYLIWPVLNRLVRNKYQLALGFIAAYWGVRWSLRALPEVHGLAVVDQFLDLSPIDCMAIGGLFAAVADERQRLGRLRTFLLSPILQWITLAAVLILMAFGVRFPGYQEFYASLFAILITGFACAERKAFSLENRALNYLGKISYGLYMYHPLVIMLSLKALKALDCLSDPVLYSLVFLTVCGISAISYEVFEKKFLKSKLRFSAVVSGDQVSTVRPA